MPSNSTIISKLSITIKTTHAFPLEFKENHKGYIDLIINEMLPEIAKKIN
jgi:imidazolonepropionase